MHIIILILIKAKHVNIIKYFDILFIYFQLKLTLSHQKSLSFFLPTPPIPTLYANNLFKYSQLLNSLIKVNRRCSMAEAVKNNGRARRPPSHLRAQYNQDNFQPGASQYSKNRESQRQASDPCSLPLMARLLSKFMTSVNKKYLESKALKAQQEANAQTKKQANETSRSSYKVQKSSKEDRVATTPKAQNSGQIGVAATKSKQVPQGYTNVTENKQAKNQNKTTDGLIKGNFPPDNFYSVQSMAKMSREQLLKMVPKGFDPTLLKQHSKQFQQQQTSKKQSKSLQSISKQNRTSMWRPDSKLFKRAAFHIGIAYNIHIDKVKQNNPNYSTDDLDPTLISRKMKTQSMQQAKRRMQEVERMRIQQEASAKQRAQSQQNFRSQQGLKKNDKKPVFIEIEDENESQMKQAMKGNDVPANQQQQIQGNKEENQQKMKSPSNMIEQEEQEQKQRVQMQVEMKERVENLPQEQMQENERIQQADEIKMKQSNSQNENQADKQMKEKLEE